ncbi:MAG: ABC transporter substrate-binding protein [Pseudomonadota bacterium]
MKGLGLIPDQGFLLSASGVSRRCTLAVLAALALFAFFTAAAKTSDEGVVDDRILFGQSAAFEGPAASLGIDFRDGVLAAFAEANAEGGVGGRALKLISYDDGYEPETSIENTRRLIENDGVFALVGEVGTPTSRSSLPLAEKHMVPFVGAFTGAEFLRDPAHATVVNIRASYRQEAEALVDYLTGELGLNRIAVLYQDDTFGRAGLEGATEALALRGLNLATSGTYMRNTTAVKRALLTIRNADPQAVIIVGAYQPASAFIKTAKSLGMAPVYAALSFVGSGALAEELGRIDETVLVSQVVPMFDDRQSPLAARFRAALEKSNPDSEPSFVAYEGYLTARLVIEALKRLGAEPTRQGFLDLFRAETTFDIDGLRLTYGPEDNQGSDKVYLTAIGRDGNVIEVARKGQE